MQRTWADVFGFEEEMPEMLEFSRDEEKEKVCHLVCYMEVQLKNYPDWDGTIEGV